MARARYIHPSVMDSPSVHRLGPTGSFFWVALILLADDEGRFHDVPEVLRGKTYPYPHSGVSLRAVKNWLATMAEEGMIFRYVAPNGNRYGEIVNFKSYNKPSHAKPSKIPAPISGNIPEVSPETSPEKFRAGLGGVGLDRVGGGRPPSGGARPPSSTPQRSSSTSPAGSAPAARAGGAAPARPASAPVLLPGGWTPEELEASHARTRAIEAEYYAKHGPPVEAPPPPPPPGPPKLSREQRAAAVRAQAAAVLNGTTPETLAEIEARLAAQDAAEHPVRELPKVAEGGGQ